ncbi:MAG: DUF58 domain-containing protein [Granulosicoccaceae bacterium]
MNKSANNYGRWLKPDVLARLGSLDLIAKTVVDGVTHGMHRSPNFGHSQDFAEYRAYNDGDDLRFIDWNVFARSNKMFIKRYRGETNSAVNLLLDTSASMGYGSPISKLDYARYILAALAYMGHRQKDALGLITMDEGVRDQIEPTSRADSLVRVLGLLEKSDAGNGTALATTIEGLGAHLTRRGVVVLVSDLYGEAADIIIALQTLAQLGHEIVIFRVLSAEEINPTVKILSTLVDLETSDKVIVDPEFIKRGYKKAFAEHTEVLEQGCRRLGIDLVNVQTDRALDDTLHRYIQFREQNSR